MSISINVSIHELKQHGRFQLSYFNPVSRRRIRKKFKLEAEAKKYAENLKTQFQANGTNMTSTHSVAVWMESYLKLNPRALIKRLGEPLFLGFLEEYCEMPVMNIDREQLLTWITELQRVRNYSTKTMGNVRSSINQFFQYIVDSKALQTNPMASIKCIKGLPPRERIILTEAEVKELLPLVKLASADLVYPVVFLLVHTGARLDEILTLKWHDVHFDLGAVQLLWTKNGEDRLIQVSNDVLSFLRSLPQDHENVVLSQYKQQWTHSQYRKQFNKFRRKIGFHKYWCNHVLRHSFATNYLIQGGNMLQLQKILGHKTLQMTVGLYGKIKASDVQNVSPFDF